MKACQAGMLTLGPQLTLSYGVQGNSQSRALVLIHGYSDSWPSYLPLMAELPVNFRVIALTMRGHGDSSRPDGGYGIKTFAADVVAAMDALAISEAVMVGHSMGSLVAQRIALDYPDRISKLVLIGAFATIKGSPAAEALWRDAISELQDPVDQTFVREFQQSTLSERVPDQFFEAVVAESMKLPARVWKDTFRALLDDDQSGRLRDIAAPTLIVWGDQDGFANRAEQELLAGRIPHARLSVHSGVGHAPHWERPQRVAREIATFIEAHDAAAG